RPGHYGVLCYFKEIIEYKEKGYQSTRPGKTNVAYAIPSFDYNPITNKATYAGSSCSFIGTLRDVILENTWVPPQWRSDKTRMPYLPHYNTVKGEWEKGEYVTDRSDDFVDPYASK
ncbi:MAG: hypothetical protein ACW987_18630, partial [Candidatus Thorarchaeota archaeon]